MAAVAALVIAGLQSYQKVVLIEIGTNYASGRQRTYHVLWGAVLRESIGPPFDSTLTKFLREDSNVGDEQWRLAGCMAYDWRGRELYVFFPHGATDFLEPGIPFRPENLEAVREVVPNLARMVRHDLLRAENLNTSGMLAIVLREMCGDPSKDNIRRLLARWETEKRYPQLKCGLELRPAETMRAIARSVGYREPG